MGPGFVTTIHFATVVVACSVYWVSVGDPMKMSPTSIDGVRWLQTVVPVAFSQPVSVVFNNKAMVYAGAGVCAIIGTLAPVLTAALSSACGRGLSRMSWMGVIVAFFGGMVIAKGEIASARGGGRVAEGILYAFVSLFGRCLKVVVMDYMLAPKSYASSTGTQDPTPPPLTLMHTLGLCYSLGMVVTLVYAIATESLGAALLQLTPTIVFFIILSAFSALALNMLGGVVLKDLGASAQQIVGKLNTICIAAISVAFLGERLPAVVVCGTLLVLAGVVVFERGEHRKGASQYTKSSTHDEDCEEPAE